MADLWIEVDLDAVIHNYQQIKAKLAPPCRLMAVVKADAYGLGAVEVAKALAEEGCEFFAVTTIAEALILRQEGLEGRILVLGPTSQEDWAEAVTQGIELAVSQLSWIPHLEEIAAQTGCKALLHLKLETGMGRTGFTGEQLTDLAAALQQAPNLEVAGAFTHFARGAQRDRSYTRWQFAKYQDYVSRLEDMGLKIPLKHVCNSAAFLDYPEYHLDMVRVGTLLGGHFPAPAFAGTLDLRDPWTAKARIVHLQNVPKGTYVGYQSLYKSKRETTLAVIPVGYADGFGLEPKLVPQGLFDLAKIIVKNTAAFFGLHLGREKLLLKGQPVSTAGKIGMQLTVLDVGRIPCQLGEEVVIPLRRTLANPRIPRIYKKNGKFYRKRVVQEGFLSINEECI
ncbi:MAG TPA: alanine racemase [Peptococcaceae bacterium]|nr:alanine racemase [Peptococcaceae bacterium]